MTPISILRSVVTRTFHFVESVVFLVSARFVPVRGINLGGGSWRRLGWINIDSLHQNGKAEKVFLNAESRLPMSGSSLKYAFSSHFFEHVDDATAQNLFNECHRILKSGGVFRIAVPDFDLARQKYLDGDHAFFDLGDWGLMARYENWRDFGVDSSLENKLSFLLFNYENKASGKLFPPWRFIPGYYCGPVLVEQEVFKAKVRELNVHQVSQWLRAQAPEQHATLGHINSYDFAKLDRMLRLAGFSRVIKSEFRRSQVSELRSDQFDNRPGISLFVEAFRDR